MTMNKPFLGMLICFALTACSSDHKNIIPSLSSDVTKDSCINLATLANSGSEIKDQNIYIKGHIQECDREHYKWIRVYNADGKTIIAEAKDESLVFPEDCLGKNVILECNKTQVVSVFDEEHTKNKYNAVVVHNARVVQDAEPRLKVTRFRFY